MASPSPNPNPKIRRESAAAAVDALLKWMRARAKQQKAQLLEHDDLLYLVLTLRRIPPKGRINPYRIPLPHPLHPLDPSSTSICLLSSNDPSSLSLPTDLPISQVISLSDLRSDYRPFEARRRLCDSHDLFFADRRILPLLPRHLGNHFFKRKKIPLALDLSRRGWPEQLRHSLGTTLLYLRTGTCSGLKVGRVSQNLDQIVDNVMAAIDGAIEFVPKKWANVRSLHIKSVDSVALPIYQAVPEMGFKIEVKGEILMEDGGKEKLGGSKKRAAKKGRIHEVGYMDADAEVDNGDGDDSREEKVSDELDVERRMRKKLKRDADSGDEKGSDALGGEKRVKKNLKKGLKPKREEEKKGEVDGWLLSDDCAADANGLVNEEDDGMCLGDQEEKVSDELGVGKRTSKKGTKKRVKKGKRGGNDNDGVDRGHGGEEKWSDKLNAKKRVKEDAGMKKDDSTPVADGLKKKNKTKKLGDKDVKKTRRSKVRHDTA